MWWRRWSRGLGSWVLSGFTPRASQTSHVQLWPIGLRAGSPTLVQAQLECCGNAVAGVCMCVYVGKLWLTGGRLLSSAVGLSVTPPTSTTPAFHNHHSTPLLPHPLAPFGHACPHAAPSAKCTQRMRARTGTSTHMASINQGCMDPL